MLYLKAVLLEPKLCGRLQQNEVLPVKRQPVQLAILVEAFILLGPLAHQMFWGIFLDVLALLSWEPGSPKANPWTMGNEELEAAMIALPFGLFAFIQLIGLALCNGRNQRYRFSGKFWIALACGIGCSVVVMDLWGAYSFVAFVLPPWVLAIHMVGQQICADMRSHHLAILAIEQREKGEAVSYRCPRCNSIFEVTSTPGKAPMSTTWLASCQC